jgi:thioredoxin-dependent peroxiredoxin
MPQAIATTLQTPLKSLAKTWVYFVLFSVLLLMMSCISSFADDNAVLEVGTPAPEFNLPSTIGKNIQLKDYQGRNLILVFYPKDQTYGCTIQLCALRDIYPQLQKMSTAVLASNPDSLESHQEFVKKQNYQFPILVDREKTMTKAYHTQGLFGFNERTVYIIDGKGIIRYAKRGLPPTSELLEALKTIKN